MAETGGNDVMEIVQLIVEIILLTVKFWASVVEAIVKMFITPEEESVQGETVVVTGAGHGMGKQMALQYAKLGANVLCWDVNEKNNLQTVKEIKAAGGKAAGYTIDVTSRSAILELADKIQKEHGFVSIVVNNAGIMPCHPLLEHTESEIRLMYEVNVLSHFWIIQAFLPEMKARNKGHFVAMSSCAGLFGLINLVPYCGTKFAVRGYMQALAEEMRRLNKDNKIKFTTIYPYMVDTGLCKKPKYRFEKMLKLVDPKDAAASIINAQRTGLSEASIPRHFVAVEKIGRLLPKKGMALLNDFLDTYVDSDK